MQGISSCDLGKPNYEKALIQHKNYIKTLKQCGVNITILPPDNNYPDSTFVEDTAILTNKCAIITNLGANSRQGEEIKIKETLGDFYNALEEINRPATIEGGDVMQVDDKFYIGLSERTNTQGAEQFINILEKYNYKGIKVSLEKVLHLKTGVTYIGNNTLLATGEFVNHPVFQNYNIIEIEESERYAANSIRVNSFVITPKGYPISKKAIEDAGFKTKTVDVSEFKKIDGGLSCLSLRF
jgi:dimethylargininase